MDEKLAVNDDSNVAAFTPLSKPADNKPENTNLPISWTGPEFVAYGKSPIWYLSLIGVCILMCAILYLLTRDIITIVVVIVAFISLGIYGARKPKEIAYSVDNASVQIGAKKYFYESFRNFNVTSEGEFTTVTLFPLKRFAFTVSLNITQTNEKSVLDVLNEQVPLEKHQPDLIDRLMSKIKF